LKPLKQRINPQGILETAPLPIVSERKKGKGIIILFTHFQASKIASPLCGIHSPVGNLQTREAQVFY
jgi:hypothetical protein